MRHINLVLLGLVGNVLAHGSHGDHGQKPMVADDANWMTKHMAGKVVVWSLVCIMTEF
jgi:hypothetical protein